MDILETVSYKKIDIREIGALSMAYLGDSVWELILRTHFIQKGYDLNRLDKSVKKYTNAKKQSEIFLSLEKELEEAELDFVKRARNAKTKFFRKSCDVIEYRHATAFEALLAYYFLNNSQEKIKEILKNYIEGADNEKGN